MSVKERPIIFSGDMVRAILAGRKTQTRRVIKHQELPLDAFVFYEVDGNEVRTENESPLVCPYGKPGDHLWVRETLTRNDKFLGTITYAATPTLQCTDPNATDNLDGWSLWRFKRQILPAIYMPRWASRITLEITVVRVQRVQEISDEDAIAEGCQTQEEHGSPYYKPSLLYMCLWDEINAKRGFRWETNPWVWALTFRRLP